MMRKEIPVAPKECESLCRVRINCYFVAPYIAADFESYLVFHLYCVLGCFCFVLGHIVKLSLFLLFGGQQTDVHLSALWCKEMVSSIGFAWWVFSELGKRDTNGASLSSPMVTWILVVAPCFGG